MTGCIKIPKMGNETYFDAMECDSGLWYNILSQSFV